MHYKGNPTNRTGENRKQLDTDKKFAYNSFSREYTEDFKRSSRYCSLKIGYLATRQAIDWEPDISGHAVFDKTRALITYEPVI